MFKKFLSGLIIISLSTFLSQASLAKGAGKGPGMKGHAGGQSGKHMSERGRANSNAQHLPDSTRGQERAQQRMSEQGKKHRKQKQRNEAEDDKD